MWLSPSGQVAHTTLDWRLCRTRIFIIIDEDEIDYMEDTLADLAGKPTSKDNIFKKVESALSRFLRQKDANGNQYYYESIHVQSARDYENYLKNLLQK